jgi:hypothetical protein
MHRKPQTQGNGHNYPNTRGVEAFFSPSPKPKPRHQLDKETLRVLIRSQRRIAAGRWPGFNFRKGGAS